MSYVINLISKIDAQRLIFGSFTQQLFHQLFSPINVFPEKELRGLSPNIQIHVSVSEFYIPRIGLLIFLQQNRQTGSGNIQKAPTDTWMWKLGLRLSNSFLGAYLFRIFGIVSLQCTKPTSLSQTLPLALGTASPPNSKGGHGHFRIWHPSLVPEHTGIELGLHIPVPNCLQHWPKKLYEGGDHILYG